MIVDLLASYAVIRSQVIHKNFYYFVVRLGNFTFIHVVD